MLIKRILEDTISEKLDSGKAIIVLGARQTGKTTLLKAIAERSKQWLFLNCDDAIVRAQLENANESKIRQLIGSHKLVFIDEGQRVKNIGLALKLFTDIFRGVQLLVSGSSSLELANQVNEPLTGRKWEYKLFPISWLEFTAHYGYLEAQRQLEHRLVYGMYPEVITQIGQEKEILQQLSGSYLYKDLFAYQGIRKPELLEKLLKALALQLGNEVSYNELSRLLEIDKKTVESYLNLLEKAFVIIRLQPLSRNLRKEIASTRKIYFVDNGIRNALIANFQPLSLRTDIGALWENFMMIERMKLLHYTNTWANLYFWRTHTKQEIDFIEERDGRLHAFEFKWNPGRKVNFPKTFLNAYTNSQTDVISQHNFQKFLTHI